MKKISEKNHLLKCIRTSGIIISFIIVLVTLLHVSKEKGLESKNIITGEPTLYGANEINPSTMYKERTYSWSKMGEALPDGYHYVGDLKYESSGELKSEFDFIAKFEAEGQVYFNQDNPDCLYVKITTDWIDNSYVIFTAKQP